MNSPLKRAGAVIGFMAVLAAALVGAAITAPSASIGQETTPHLMLELEGGTVDIALLPAIAPQHVERIVTLAEQGFYDGIVFHRVIPGFMAQTGDPTGTGMGGSDLPNVPAEFSGEAYARGTVGAARSMSPDSFNSQFFICLQECSHLNGQYTVFGTVVSGMELVDAIAPGQPPASPDQIVSAKIDYK